MKIKKCVYLDHIMLNNDTTIIQQTRMASRISFFKEFSRITKIWKATEENLLIFDFLPNVLTLTMEVSIETSMP